MLVTEGRANLGRTDMGESMDDAGFDRKLDAFERWQSTPWGRLRYRIAAANLATHLPAGRSLAVLDVGGGNGLDVLELAALGHRVTIADLSRPSLASAEALAAERGLADHITTAPVAIDDLATEFGHAAFDIVLCHNVIQYLPESPISALAAQLAHTGLLSVIAPNAAADPLLTAVRSRNLTEALRLLDAPTRVAVTYDTEARACYADDIAGDLRDAGLEVLAHSGIRVVCDLVTDDARKSEPDFYADLERLELALTNRAPYPHFARMFQLIARPSRTR
ncbi:class I SAM-dependent methyltransferase [Nocardia ignorata]|uniref:class I SAM-dependent methyltransferase n=2 Tax=Nocardia ignorata TaxID=145285 RepID=UPI00366754DF